ncbi:MAG: ROK family protein [Clostridia bacterium]|nr:ROK family protein [Clostridia bacterium]
MKIGVDIGGTKCAVVLGDHNGIAKKIRFETKGPEETIANIKYAVASLADHADAIGISCGGPLDAKKGLILSPPNLLGWDRIPITAILSEAFGMPAYLCNDADACALAEYRYGSGKGTENMIFLTFGTGMGAGLILNGKLYTGTNGMAGEIGHIRLENYGPVGYGKRGSFESFCSGGGIAQIGRMLALEQLQQGNALSWCQNAGELDRITAKLLAEHAFEGDKTALEVYRICGEMLGRGISVLIDILNPEMIVIGSIYSRSGALLEKHMEEVLKKEALPASRAQCRIAPAMLGEQIGDYGALAVAYGI